MGTETKKNIQISKQFNFIIETKDSLFYNVVSGGSASVSREPKNVWRRLCKLGAEVVF